MADDRKFIDKNNATAIDPLERHDDTRANSTGIIGIHRGQAARPDPRPIIPRVRRSGGPSLYRRRVPRDLVARFGRSEISLTLGDCGSRESARRAAELDVGVMRMFAAARAYPELSEADLARLVDAFIVRTKASWRAMSAWPDLREQ